MGQNCRWWKEGDLIRRPGDGTYISVDLPAIWIIGQFEGWISGRNPLRRFVYSATPSLS